MSASIEASLRLEIAQYQQQLAKAKAEVTKFRESLNTGGGVAKQVLGTDEDWNRARSNIAAARREMNNLRSTPRGMQLGGVAMQAQDIAVQLQMGTKASLVLAQQGSQILGAFGTGGAVLGGVLAVGGAFFTMAEKSREAFDAMKADADGFATRMRASLSGTSTEIAAFFGEVKSGVNSAYSEIEKLNSGPSGIMARLTQFIGGPSVSEREGAANNLALQKANALATIQQALLDMSAKELRIAEMKAAGEDKAAAALQRQLDLQREIQRIQGTDLPDEVKARLAQDATRKASLAGVEAPDKKAGERQLAELKTLRKEAAQIALDMLPDDEQLTALKSKLEDVLMAARVRNIGTRITEAADIGTLADKQRAAGNPLGEAAALRDYKSALDIQRQIARLQERITADADRAAKMSADKARQDRETAARLQQEHDAANAQRRDAVMNVQDEYSMLKARGTRRKSDDYQVERDSAIRRRREQLMKDNGLGYQEADALATEMRDMEERNANGGRAPKIRNTGRKKGMGSAGGGGLDGFYRQQGQAWGVNALPESRFDKLQREGFDWSAGLKGKQEANASAAASNRSMPVTFSQKELEIFMAIKDSLIAFIKG